MLSGKPKRFVPEAGPGSTGALTIGTASEGILLHEFQNHVVAGEASSGPRLFGVIKSRGP